jgi:hypothetical protein
MSVLAEAISVITPIEVLDAKYPGGLAAYRRDCPNATYCADTRLTRVGFMVPDDVRHYVEQLAARGLTHIRGGKAVDLVVVDQFQGPTTPCDWIEGGRHPGGYSAVWASGTDPGTLAHPSGWTAEHSKGMLFTSNDEVSERLLRLGMTGRLDTFLDFRTGREVYVGRTRPRTKAGADD